MDNGIFFGKKGRHTMTEYDRPLTPRQIRAVKDETIDFSDIPDSTISSGATRRSWNQTV